MIAVDAGGVVLVLFLPTSGIRHGSIKAYTNMNIWGGGGGGGGGTRFRILGRGARGGGNFSLAVN